MNRSTIIISAISGFIGVALGFACARLLVAQTAHPEQQAMSAGNEAGKPVETARQDLAATLLDKLEFPKRYEDCIAGLMPLLTGRTDKLNSKINQWLRKTMVEHLGWEKEKATVTQFYASRLTEAEIKEAIQALEQPALKKALALQASAWEAAAKERAERAWKFWDDYNAGQIKPPPDVMKH